MDNQENELLPRCLANRKNKVDSITKCQSEKIFRNNIKKNKNNDTIFKKEEIGGAGMPINQDISFKSISEDSTTSDVIENSDNDDNLPLTPVPDNNINLKNVFKPINITLKSNKLTTNNTLNLDSPSKNKKIVVISEIIMNPNTRMNLNNLYLNKPSSTVPNDTVLDKPSDICLHKVLKQSDAREEYKNYIQSDKSHEPKNESIPSTLAIKNNLPVISQSMMNDESNKEDMLQSLEPNCDNSLKQFDIINNPEVMISGTFQNEYILCESIVDKESSVGISNKDSSVGTALNNLLQKEILTDKEPDLAISGISELNDNYDENLDQDLFETSESLLKDTNFYEQPTDNPTHESEASTQQIEKKKRKRRKVNKFRKSCLDFVSDEEVGDFSAGSSDDWAEMESESSSDDDSHSKTKTKKKLKMHKETITKKRVKKTNIAKLRKKLKDDGKAHQTRSGSEKLEKCLQENPCTEGKCGRNCQKVSEERRRNIFDFFWSLEPQRRRDWLVHNTKAVPIKRQKTKLDHSRRKITYEYYFNEGEGHVQVCQRFLLKTLDITQKFLLYTLTGANEGLADKDKRHSNAIVKYDEPTKAFAKKFIEDLPTMPSHYCRKESTCLYLPQEFKSLANLYRLYCKECTTNSQERLSEALFNKLFRDEYNIRFHIPKKDKCALCTAYENKDQKESKDVEKMESHIEEKKASYKRFKLHQNLIDSETVTCSFDLQKVLNTPYGQSMLLYYSRKYGVYNLTMYESRTQNVSCYIWGESDAKRGSNEIATCLYKYLIEVDNRAVKNLLLYCDSCAGQNKNKVILAVLNHFLHLSKNIEVIQINYLLPGHSYMPVDSVHAIIENEVKKVIVWSPEQWPTYIESARKRPRPYNVNVLEYFDFIDWNTITTETFTKETLKQFKMTEIRVATFKKKNLKNMEIKTTMKDGAAARSISLFAKATTGKGKGRGKGKLRGKGLDESQGATTSTNTINKTFVLPPLYTNRLPISVSKANDLKRLCNKDVIPRRFHNFYHSLPTSDNVRDMLLETDEDDIMSED